MIIFLRGKFGTNTCFFLHGKPHGYLFAWQTWNKTHFFLRGKLGTKHMDNFLAWQTWNQTHGLFFAWQTWNQTHGFFFPDFQFRHVHACNAEGSDWHKYFSNVMLTDASWRWYFFWSTSSLCWIVTVKSRIAAAIATWETTPVLDFQVDIPKLAASC